MGIFESHLGMSSAGVFPATPSITDPNGYTLRDYPRSSPSDALLQIDEVGFDPQKSTALNDYQVYLASQWPEFEREDDLKSSENQVKLEPCETDKFVNTVSNSTASTNSREDGLPAKSQPAEPPRDRGKGWPRNSEVTTTTAGRNRKPTRKPSTTIEVGDSPEEQKRKQLLEKNRQAAAKWRIKNKEKTKKLQRENAYLKDQVERMKNQIQYINEIPVAHTNYKGYKSPEEIPAHLNALDNDFFIQQLTFAGYDFGEFSQMDFSGLSDTPNRLFSTSNPGASMYAPLQEFNPTAEFDVHTPAAD
ncbi:uncharacterized protein PV07_10531 [Cladophialophora immunda]|uniref:BZIP domain-containing protein n=1 Tax=Cladophialophora immunda TaxID=569365 RepID=A0A0D2C0J3_9EURO|nr:uncharacterized protein PV07_10531 [Cladophialophora immunda]KIW24843.1 hypothetical protein PV07_10531 [Cladophialophora immunda]